ncbi:MAG: hypothetical protein A2010_08880 [Nitrospirae bacterium GWD2_57_9]|nr:MAG: hypothetical protein A2010_08880 [Nitrospirae bacterium GWD2_57_9]
MRINVSKPVLTQTTLCQNEFACLSSALTRLCKVRGHLMKDALIIDCAAGSLCKYQLSFGSWSVCSCPTRKEIYDRYTV